MGGRKNPLVLRAVAGDRDGVARLAVVGIQSKRESTVKTLGRWFFAFFAKGKSTEVEVWRLH